MTLALFITVLGIVLIALAAFKVPEPTWLSYFPAGVALIVIAGIVLGRVG